MISLQDTASLLQYINRINSLKPDSQRQWGKMNVGQMMAHCSNALETNLGDKQAKRGFMALLFGKLAKKSVLNGRPFKKGLPTDPSFVVTDERDFKHEQQRLIKLLTRFSQTKPEVLAQVPHPFFGPLTGEEWNMLNAKHLDHHLQQFGS
jgi:hypothetical protein